MLPWLFGVLFAMNVALFYWGYQREKSQEPAPPELLRMAVEIRLMSEPATAGDMALDAGATEAQGVPRSEVEATGGEIDPDGSSSHETAGIDADVESLAAEKANHSAEAEALGSEGKTHSDEAREPAATDIGGMSSDVSVPAEWILVPSRPVETGDAPGGISPPASAQPDNSTLSESSQSSRADAESRGPLEGLDGNFE